MNRLTIARFAYLAIPCVGIALTLTPRPASAAPVAPSAPAAASATTAVAAPTTFGRPASALGTRANSGPDRRVQSFWTPARMAAAKPLDLTTGKAIPATSGALTSLGVAGSTSPAAPTLAPSAARLATKVTNYSRTNGKLFIVTATGKSGWCSASALNTSTKRVVVTAGHCVYDKSLGGWMRNAVFVPGYDSRNADKEPVGRWQARSYRTFNAWITNRDNTRDVAMITMYNGGDRNARVVDAVGGHGLSYGGSRSGWDFSHFGYPGNKNGGGVMWACWGTTTLYRSTYPTINCNFLAGSSGGPWLFQYNNSNGLGYVRGVTSFGPTATDTRSMSPYFDSAVKTMMDQTVNDW